MLVKTKLYLFVTELSTIALYFFHSKIQTLIIYKVIMAFKSKSKYSYYIFVFCILTLSILPSRYLTLNPIHIQSNPAEIVPLQKTKTDKIILFPTNHNKLQCNSVHIYTTNQYSTTTIKDAVMSGANGSRLYLPFNKTQATHSQEKLSNAIDLHPLYINNLTLSVDTPTNTQVATILESIAPNTPLIESPDYDILARFISLGYKGGVSLLITNNDFKSIPILKKTFTDLITLSSHNIHTTIPISALKQHKKFLAHISSLGVKISIIEDHNMSVPEQHLILKSAIKEHLWLPYAIYVSKRYQTFCDAYLNPDLGEV